MLLRLKRQKEKDLFHLHQCQQALSGKIVLTMKQVSQSFLISQAVLTKQDGILSLLNLGGKKDKDLRVLMIGLTFQVMETYQMQKPEFKSQAQILQAWELEQLKVHALQTKNIALTKTIQPNGLVAQLKQLDVWNMVDLICIWHQ